MQNGWVFFLLGFLSVCPLPGQDCIPLLEEKKKKPWAICSLMGILFLLFPRILNSVPVIWPCILADTHWLHKILGAYLLSVLCA